jgi:predicted DNA-binding protein
VATKKTKDQTVAVRLSPEVRRNFINLSAKYGGTSFVLRELVTAFIENRIEIEAPKLNPLFTKGLTK